MFSFHKPKIYRSNLGCCICKAKSSSSRFTDSKKYENEFERCFRIQDKRSGEICNACVLLVKRWKKLSPENRLTKHWHHVVDARAGPGTKLASTRRLIGPSSSSSSSASSNHHDHSATSSSCQANSSNAQQQQSGQLTGCQHQQLGRQQAKQQRAEGVLPLSSSQANNQSAGCSSNSSSSGVRRVGSFSSNKARAIDTNVSTFTFGLDPPGRRGCMATESSSCSSSAGFWSSSSPSSYSSFAKPQSALSSSAFESVIKRYRQRQQQQQLVAKRRQQRFLQQQQQQQQEVSSIVKPAKPTATKRTLRTQIDPTNAAKIITVKSKDDAQTIGQQDQADVPIRQQQATIPSKRLKRSSESIGSISVDGLRVSSLLDISIWRKEKICCGIIFRGAYNEVAVFPKLLKPCQCRASKQLVVGATAESTGAEQEATTLTETELERASCVSPSLPPRVTKSGSISSYDSNTSGTGSMEQPPEEQLEQPITITTKTSGHTQEQRRRTGLRSLNATTIAAVSTAKVDYEDTSADRFPSGANATKATLAAATGFVLGGRPRSAAGSSGRRSASAAGRKLCIDTDSNISSSSSVFSSATTGRTSSSKGSSEASDSTGQQVHSPANSTTSSGSSTSSRLLLMADDEELILDDDEEEDEEESNTDASCSVESLSGVERKKSSVSAVGAIG